MHSILHRLLKPLCALLLGIGLFAAAGPGTAADTPAAQAVEDTASRMLVALKQQREALRADPSKIYGLVERIAVPRFDFEAISQWVLGRNWRGASPEQRQRFTAEFQNLLVRIYSNALLEYSDETVRFLPGAAPNADGDVLVRSEFVRRAGPAVPINYSVHQKNGQWLVYDVTVDGVSLVANYRTTFANQVRDQGMDGLIASLAKLNASGGK